MKESLLTEIFMHAGLFLVLSALIVPALKYIKIPNALGYLLAGIALGPYALGSLTSGMAGFEILNLHNADHVKVLAELGIVLLLFVIGLEMTPRRLWQMRGLVFGLGTAQVLISALVVGGIAYLWGNSVQVSILLGLGLALSSTALITQWLHEKKLFASDVGRSSFGILLLQDLAVIPILLLLTILSTELGDNVLSYVSISLLKMAAAVVFIYGVGKVILKPVFLFANRHGGAEVFMALSLLVIVLSASAASLAGLSMALGAFIAGLLLADTEYRHEISSFILPFKRMLIGIFFFSFGMGIDLYYVAEKPFWLIASVIGLMAIKAGIVFALCRLWKQSMAVSAEAALLLCQAGEFGLLVVGTALSVGLMEETVGQFMLITVGITMMVTPLLTPLALKIGCHLERIGHASQDYHARQAPPMSQHIVLFGYGRVGSLIGHQLCQEGLQIIGFDSDINRVNQARLQSIPVYYGDASRDSTLEAARLEEALCAVVTIDQPEAALKMVASIRHYNSEIPIVVRAMHLDALPALQEQPNVEAIAEDWVISDELSDKVLTHCRAQG